MVHRRERLAAAASAWNLLVSDDAQIRARLDQLDAQAESFSIDLPHAQLGGASSRLTIGESPIIGNPAIITEVRDLLARHGTSQEALEVSTPWDGVHLPVETHLIGGLNFNGAGAKDALLIRSFTTYVAAGEEAHRETVTFVARVDGVGEFDTMHAPSADVIRGAKILWWGRYPGDGVAIADLAISLDPASNRHTVSFSEFVSERMAFEPRHLGNAALPFSEKSVEAQYLSDRSLFESINRVLAYTMNSRGYLSTLIGVNMDIGGPANEAAENLDAIMANRVSFAITELRRRYETVNANADDVAYYNSQDPDFLPFVNTTLLWAKKMLTLSEAENVRVAETVAKASEVQSHAISAFRWKGQPMTRAGFLMELGRIADPDERRALQTAYTGNVLEHAYRADGGLFAMLDPLNDIAAAHGYANYAEYYLNTRYDSNIATFDQTVRDYHLQHGNEIAAFIAELQGANGGLPVNEWDVDYLANKLVCSRLGIESIPEVSLDDAAQATKAFYRDMGLDLDRPPFAGNIHYDLFLRAGKYPNLFAETLGYGEEAWFNANFDPTKTIDIFYLGAFAHEWGHNVHQILGGQNSGRNRMNGIDGQPFMFVEGMGAALQSITSTRAWIDRYLAHLPQFSDPALRQEIGRVREQMTLYHNMMVLCRARFELNLYETRAADGTARPLNERLEYWRTLTRTSLHVDTMDPAHEGAHVYSTSHFCSTPAYYVSYMGALNLANRVTAPVRQGLERGDVSEMQRGGAIIGNIFSMGGRLPTLAAIDTRLTQLLTNVALLHAVAL